MPPEGRVTERLARVLVDHAGVVLLAILAGTLFFAYPLLNSALRLGGAELPGPTLEIGTDPADLLPRHRYIQAQRSFADRFGNSSLVLTAIVVDEGTVFEPETLAKIERLTRGLDGEGYDRRPERRRRLRERLEARGLPPAEIRTELDRRFPPYPVNHDRVRSLTHPDTRYTVLAPNGDIETRRLVPEIPETKRAAERLRGRAWDRAPEIFGQLVSQDERAALVLTGFVRSRLDAPAVNSAVFEHIRALERREEDARHEIHVVGDPMLTGWVLHHMGEFGLFLGISVLLIFAMLWLSFRNLHGVLIPLAAAFTSAVWGFGFSAWMGMPFDPLVFVVPMLIFARAVSHTVQMAARFFEEYAETGEDPVHPAKPRRAAAARAMSRTIVPGCLGILTDAAGMLVILVTSIPQMRHLGLLGAFWVLSFVVTVEILHPVLIALLPAPRERGNRKPRMLVALGERAGALATHPRGRYAVAIGALALFGVSLYGTLAHSRIGETAPGAPVFWPDHPFNVAAGEIGDRFGGPDTFVAYMEGDRPGASEAPESIRLVEKFDRWMRRNSAARESLSLVPLLHSANRRLNYNDPKMAFVPSFSQELIAQLRFFSPPGFLASLLTDDGKDAAVTLFFPDHRGPTIARATQAAEAFIDAHPTGEVRVRLERDRARPGAGWLDPERLRDALHYMVGPMLPPRRHSLYVTEQRDRSRETREIAPRADGTPPPWLSGFREAALEAWRAHDERDAVQWPDDLADWELEDVSHWWSDEEHGLRLAVVGGDALLVESEREVRSGVEYQPAGTWTRGVEFVLAGGTLGTLAAVNEEVERAHVANISLILAVIFVLHALTYRSATSGAIIVFQLATATLASLAYMALRGVGLNIHTLPVQSVAVGIGVDYAIYVVDRIREETRATRSIDTGIRRAVSTTGVAVILIASTIVLSVLAWSFSSLRFQAEMAQLLAILMAFNMVAAIVLVPALYSILKPRSAGVAEARPRDPREESRSSPEHRH